MSDTKDDQSPATEEGQASPATREDANGSLGSYIKGYIERLRTGELGAIPIIVGIASLGLIFSLLEPVFYGHRNFVNLLLQMAGITTIAIGVVFVLLLGEIDLSIGFVSGVVGVTMVLILRPEDPGWPWYLAIVLALVAAAGIGFLHGMIITRFGVPSFIVTLAGFLAWSGVVLILTTQASTAGTIVIQDDVVIGIAGKFLPKIWGWVLALGVVGGWAANQWYQQFSRSRRGLPTKPSAVIGIQVIALAAVVGGAVYYANLDRGIPAVSLLLLALLLFWNFVATRTRFGRHVYAVGGNEEAARRAGINVNRVKVAVFMISSVMAGVGGIILASRLRSVDTSAGGGNLLLNSIAAAVIGGTSLFGGYGAVTSALYGGIIIATVENGMGLLGLPSGVKFVVTGLVLLAAVLVDAIARRKQTARGT
jgi:D-xylose transport system permease protein